MSGLHIRAYDGIVVDQDMVYVIFLIPNKLQRDPRMEDSSGFNSLLEAAELEARSQTGTPSNYQWSRDPNYQHHPQYHSRCENI